MSTMSTQQQNTPAPMYTNDPENEPHAEKGLSQMRHIMCLILGQQGLHACVCVGVVSHISFQMAAQFQKGVGIS